MVEADFSGNFANADNCAEGTTGVVLSEGEYVTKQNQKQEDYQQLEIQVEVAGKKLTHAIRNSEGKDLVKAWGSDTKKWVGKKFKILHITYQWNGERKKRVELEAVKE